MDCDRKGQDDEMICELLKAVHVFLYWVQVHLMKAFVHFILYILETEPYFQCLIETQIWKETGETYIKWTTIFFFKVCMFLNSIHKLPCTFSFKDFPGGSDGRQSACSAGDLDLIAKSGKSLGKGSDYPLQCSCLENSMDRGAWQTNVPWSHKESDMTEQLTL